MSEEPDRTEELFDRLAGIISSASEVKSEGNVLNGLKVELFERLARLEEQGKHTLEELRDLRSVVNTRFGEFDGRLRVVEKQVDDVTDHENRLRKIEQRIWWATGAAAAIGAALPYLIHVFSEVVTHITP